MEVAELNRLSDAEADHALSTVCTAPRWVDQMLAGRPYPTARAIFDAAANALSQLTEADLDAALSGHPKIGAAATGAGAAQSRREQAGLDADDAELVAALAAGNRAYEERFGRIYLVCAAGKTGPELFAILQQRLGNDPATELAVTRAELGKINRLRLERMVTA